MNLCKLLLKNTNNQLQLVRGFKSNLKIKWVRPEKVSCIKPEKSGDVGTLPPLKPNEYMLDFKNSKELATADDVVKSLFQLHQNPRIHASNYYRESLIKEVQRHPLDYGSMEAKLAKMTATIRRLQEIVEDFPSNKKMKVICKEMIDKRKKYLKYLRRWDYKRFEWILEKLDLVYKPPPPLFHWITRKESLQKLTNLHCESVREERIREYREQLESQQIPFLEQSIKKMKFLRKEQEDLEIPVTITDADIAAYEKQLTELRKLRSEADKQINENVN